MPRFRCSYTFTDKVVGDAEAIRKAIRNFSFDPGFNLDDLNHLRVTRTSDGQNELAAKRTISVTYNEASQRAALRRFCYEIDLPEELDLSQLQVVELDGPQGVIDFPPIAEAV